MCYNIRMNKGFSSLTVILLALGIVVVGSAVWYFGPRTVSQQAEQPLIAGGDKDAHGCIGSAGYQWCEVKQKCLRTWEEYCGSSDLDPAFNVLTAIRNNDTGVFGYTTSSAFEWRLEGNTMTTIQGLAITATGAHGNDYKLAESYFKDNGFAASLPNEAGGPTGGLQGYQKGNVVCVLGFAYTDLARVPNAPIQVNSDMQNITVSCGNLPTQSSSTSGIGISDWKTYTSTQFGFSLRYPPTFTHVGESVSNEFGEGIRIGPAVFVIVTDAAKRVQAKQEFDQSYNLIKNPPAPSSEEASLIYSEIPVNNPSVSIHDVKFKGGFYAFIEGNSYDIFVDGDSYTFDSKANNYFNTRPLGNDEITLLSTFRFSSSAQ